MQVHELALQRNKYKHLSDNEWRWMLQQAEGRERTADKLPAFASIPDWWYPVRLSCEQCSSELTARYKAQIVNRQSSNRNYLDLTGGYGVDTYFLSRHFAHTDYVEQDKELCRIAEHNFNIQRDDAPCSITIHNTSAEAFLHSAEQYDLLYLDPARRNDHGGKVFRLEECTPDVATLLPTLLAHLSPTGRIMLKLSPMLDITQALSALAVSHGSAFDVHIVAVKNEVKEVLLLSHNSSDGVPTITAIDLAEKDKSFVFTREEELNANSQWLNANSQWLNANGFLYEPNAAILKAGAYKTVASRFGIQKAAPNTHLYFSDRLIAGFPGRVWCIRQIIKDRRDLPAGMRQANVLTRNHPLKAEQLKKHLRLNDGGAEYVIGFRLADKPVTVLAERVPQT